MGLDLALGGLVLLMAVRGWLRGFVVQAIRLGGLVAAAYAAAPVRDQVRPYALQYLPAIPEHLSDRIFWWASAAVSYLVIVGVASLIVAISRRQPYGLAEPQRGDQFGGFGLGVIKGLLFAAFLVAGLDRYGQSQMAKISWAADQTTQSYAWMWNEKYRPAARVWASQPVQEFVAHVQKMGLKAPAESGEASSTARTTNTPHSPNLALLPPAFPEDAAAEVDHDLESIRKLLSEGDTPR